VSHAIEEVAEEEMAEASDGENASAGDSHAELRNSASQTSLIRQRLSSDDNGIFFTPVLNSQGMKKLCYKVQKSSWNEPYSSSFTELSSSKMALYR